ncbi:MAG: CHAT domain-containing protein [Anaerolineae bacterium]|nr:CHAT domain-containing protein [Anaerolineae bacterium]
MNEEKPVLEPEHLADWLAERFKAEADRHWWIDPRASLCFAAANVQLGDALRQPAITALGAMSRGDALKLLNRRFEAWTTLEQAGELYLSAGDEIGWARTRIGKLAVCVQINRVEEAMRDAYTARAIFTRHSDWERALRLDINCALAESLLGNHDSSLALYQRALKTAQDLGKAGESYRGLLHINVGYAQQGLGELREALAQYRQAHTYWEAQGNSVGVVMADFNIASIAQAQGHYRDALRVLYRIHEPLRKHYESEADSAQRTLIECYLHLNRFDDARDLANAIIQRASAETAPYLRAITLIQLAIAEAGLAEFDAALAALEQAEPLLEALNATTWHSILRLRRAQIYWMQAELPAAHAEIERAVNEFVVSGQRVYLAQAYLLRGQIALAEGDLPAARASGKLAHSIGRTLRDPNLTYHVHMLFGEIGETEQHTQTALRHYRAAAALVERVQRRLILTLRPGFLGDKQDALNALLRIYLQSGAVEEAFITLERAKAQVWFSYLSQRDQLRWLRDDPETQPLIEELSQLREEHHWFYRVASDQVFREQQHAVILPEQAAHEAAIREERMRNLTEQLYLLSAQRDISPAPALNVADMRRCLNESTRLVAYYNDGARLWAFVLSRTNIEVCALPESVQFIDQLLEKMQANIGRALRAGAESTDATVLHKFFRDISLKLHKALIAPLAASLEGCARLVVVPYGSLHYLPFHLLYSGDDYLIEQMEVVVLPTAGLIMRRAPVRPPGALALAHHWEGRLAYTREESERVVKRLGGSLYADAKANRDALRAAPCQVLHLAAHGQYRIDQPDFSHILLEDGPLYTDDLVQNDLSYELVTLSACETGRSRITAGDELVGLGRGFLFAGAGALIGSLWRVNDALTLDLMDTLYDHLRAGASKAAAMRGAQLALLRARPGLHPAFWGAFELIGNADPLTYIEHKTELQEEVEDGYSEVFHAQ